MPATSLYGTTKKTKTFKKHIWHTIKPYIRKGKFVRPHRSRRIHAITQKVGKPKTMRYTFWSKEHKYIKQAEKIMLKEKLIPKKCYEDRINAKKFVENKKYRKQHSQKGEWIEYTVKET